MVAACAQTNDSKYAFFSLRGAWYALAAEIFLHPPTTHVLLNSDQNANLDRYFPDPRWVCATRVSHSQSSDEQTHLLHTQPKTESTQVFFNTLTYLEI